MPLEIDVHVVRAVVGRPVKSDRADPIEQAETTVGVVGNPVGDAELCRRDLDGARECRGRALRRHRQYPPGRTLVGGKAFAGGSLVRKWLSRSGRPMSRRRLFSLGFCAEWLPVPMACASSRSILGSDAGGFGSVPVC